MQKKFWSAHIQNLVPYTPGEQPKQAHLIKLNTNENPFPPSPKVAAMLRDFPADNLRLYPDPESQALKQSIANYHQLQAKNIFVGNGSDEVLALIFFAFFKNDRPILFPEISYSFYPVYANLYGIEFEAVPLADDFSITPDSYQKANGGIIFPNPNAPTGRLLSLAAISDIARANRDSVVVIDEAYIDFGGESALALLADFDNLIIVQTFSKSRSLAGMRVGFAAAHEDLIAALDCVKNSFNSYPLDRVAQAAAQAALEDDAYFQQTRTQIMQNREHLSAQLQARGFTVLPSAANFIFVQHAQQQAADLMQALRQRAIIVRHFNAPKIANFLRITIGTSEECAALIAALDEILAV